MTSMAQLRRRWSNPEEVAGLLQQARDLEALGRIEGPLDLRGAEIGMDGDLSNFRLIGKSFQDIDLRFGKGCLIVVDSDVVGIRADRFAFDRASRVKNSRITDGSFAESRIKVTAEDVSFERCDFSKSLFRGGFNEYGFKRCSFTECVFSGLDWRNTFFRSCEFHGCEWSGARISKSIVVGMKFYGFREWETVLVDCQLGSVFVEGMQVSNQRD